MGDEDNCCSICWEQSTLQLDCSHYYCRPCLLQWEKQSNLCAVCRNPFARLNPAPVGEREKRAVQVLSSLITVVGLLAGLFQSDQLYLVAQQTSLLSFLAIICTNVFFLYVLVFTVVHFVLFHFYQGLKLVVSGRNRKVDSILMLLFFPSLNVQSLFFCALSALLCRAFVYRVAQL